MIKTEMFTAQNASPIKLHQQILLKLLLHILYKQQLILQILNKNKLTIKLHVQYKQDAGLPLNIQNPIININFIQF